MLKPLQFMKISIALAVYNGANYLNEQLASYLAQTRLPDELVAVDDCSTDNTYQVLQEFADTAPFPVRIFRNERNSGSTVTFSRALENCSGDLIFPSDHDDIWLPFKLERMSREFEVSPALGLLFTNSDLIDGKSQPLDGKFHNEGRSKYIQDVLDKGSVVETILGGNIVGGATSAFRSKYCTLLLPIPVGMISFLHDAWIAMIIGASAEIRFLEESLMQYRQHQSQQVGVSGKPSVNTEVAQRAEMFAQGFHLYERKLAELRSLLSRFEKTKTADPKNIYVDRAISAVENSLSELDNAFQHLKFRQSLPPNLKRIVRIAGESVSGRYHRHSNGFRSIARDLLYR